MVMYAYKTSLNSFMESVSIKVALSFPINKFHKKNFSGNNIHIFG